MEKLVLELEALINKAKGVTDLIGALFYAGEAKIDLTDFSEGLNLLYSLSYDNSRKIESVWEKMHTITKNTKKQKN